MACDASKGYKHQCYDNTGGIRNFYIMNFVEGLEDLVNITDGEITDFGTPSTPYDLYKYELRSTGHGLEETDNGEKAAGTKFWEQVVTAMLKKQDAATTEELKTVSYGTPHLIIEDYNGNFKLVGLQNGVDFKFNTATGTNFGEMNGYTITATGQEKRPALFIEPSVIGDDTNTTVVTGVNV